MKDLDQSSLQTPQKLRKKSPVNNGLPTNSQHSTVPVPAQDEKLPVGFPKHPRDVSKTSLSKYPMKAIILFEYFDDEKNKKKAEKIYYVGDVHKIDMRKKQMTICFQEDQDIWTIDWHEIDYVFHSNRWLPMQWNRLLRDRYDLHGNLLHTVTPKKLQSDEEVETKQKQKRSHEEDSDTEKEEDQVTKKKTRSLKDTPKKSTKQQEANSDSSE